MQPKETEAPTEPQYNSRRERREAEGHVRYNSRRERRDAEGRIRYTSEQKALLEDAHYYLMEQSANVEGNIKNKTLFPDAPILSLVDKKGNSTTDFDNGHGAPVDVTDDLETQADILGAYENELKKSNWPAVEELAVQKRWEDKEAKEIQSAYPKQQADSEMAIKIGRFVGRRLAEARHFWLNKKTSEAKIDDTVSFLSDHAGRHRTESGHAQDSEHQRAA